jgi:hypothetical protein
MNPIRTDFTGYEGRYVAVDALNGEVLFAHEDPAVVLEWAKGRNHVIVQGRVPGVAEPTYVGLG